MVAVALEPRIALPCNEIRAFVAASVVAVRARTVRVLFAFARDAAAVWRETTLRDAVFTRPFAVARCAFARDATARLCTVLREVVARDAFTDGAATAVRATVARDVVAALRGLVRPELRVVAARPDCGAATEFASNGIIGSAKTARIDNSVEHTKNAPASRKTVPTAFLKESAIF